ncbi:Uncharacterized protein Fot_13755 [Forsythia ovata]|uniref:Uncharacterized protein n=1 Tax=Forsythia ovata TaxID=205694 RepID=A0ABD1W4N0_9LAMI
MKLLKWIAVDILGSSSLPKIGLAGLAAKKIPLVAKKKSSDNDQKRILAGLSLKDGEKDKDAPPASFDPRQTVLVPSASSQGLQIMVQKQELDAKRVEKAKSKGAGSDVGRSSKRPLDDEDDLEVLEEGRGGLSQKARRPRTASSKSLQNMAAVGDGVPVVLEKEGGR